jgi:dTDP-4-dehydrorhamnose 3,5-epimerase
VPPGVVHAYRNISLESGLVFNAANQLFGGQGRREPVDEIRWEQAEGSPYQLD